MQHALRTHAKYGGSVIARVMACPGSVSRVERAPPRQPTRYQLDGTEAHELLDFALKNKYWDAREASIMAGTLERDTHYDAGERLEAVQIALDYVADLLALYEDAVLYVEHAFHFPSNVDPDNTWGTCDILIHVPSLQIVYVIDYKHGIGVTVDAEDNKQGLYYATGAVLGDEHLDAETIVITVIQPRNYHPKGRVREYVVDRDRLKRFIDEVDDAILRSLAADAPLIPGDDQCQFCNDNIACPAREAMAVRAVSDTFKTVKEITVLPDAKGLPIDRLMYIKQSKDMLLKFLSDVDDALYWHAYAGHVVPGYKLVEAQARRAWYGEAEGVAQALMRLADTTKLDDVFPRKLIGIGEAEALVKAAFRKVGKTKAKDAAEKANIALAALTLKASSGNLVLVPNTDARQAVNRVADTFANVVALPPPA